MLRRFYDCKLLLIIWLFLLSNALFMLIVIPFGAVFNNCGLLVPVCFCPGPESIDVVSKSIVGDDVSLLSFLLLIFPGSFSPMTRPTESFMLWIIESFRSLLSCFRRQLLLRCHRERNLSIYRREYCTSLSDFIKILIDLI